MHWLHVNPNSDFSTFRHFFGWFLSSFSPKFVPKFRRKTKTKFQKSAKYFFLSKYFPKLCQKNAESLPSANYLPKKWQIPKFPVFFWQNICQITAENWPKFCQKSAKKWRNRNLDLRVANAKTFRCCPLQKAFFDRFLTNHVFGFVET